MIRKLVSLNVWAVRCERCLFFSIFVARMFEFIDFLVMVVRLVEVPGCFAGCVIYHDVCLGLCELGVKFQL